MKAIEFFLNHKLIGGSQTKAARELGTSQPNVRFWLMHEGKCDMPLAIVPKAAQALGMKPSEFIAQVFE